jgi:Na+/melibiose symporter-like transporter
MGAPGLIVAALVWFTLRDPVRGAMDPADAQDADVPSLKTVAAGLLRNKTFLHVVAGGALAGFGMQSFSSFFGLYYARVYNMAPAAVGLTFGLISFANVAGGLMLSTWLANWGAKRDLRWYAWISAIGTLLSSVLYIAAFNATGLASSLGLLVIAGIVLMSYYGPAMAMAQNVATSRTRASTMAVYQLVVNLFGMGLGPLVIGYASDRLSAVAYGGPLPESCKAVVMDTACRMALSTGLRQAFMLTSILFVWASLHYFLAGRSQPKGAS